MKTFTLKKADCKKDWVLVDADGMVLGRLATTVANILRGKHKATYTPHMNCGDHVVIINCDKVRTTGRKAVQKIYYKHSGYLGGLKETRFDKVKDKTFPIRTAIERMISVGPMRRRLMRESLHLYTGSSHPHQGVSFVKEIKESE